MKVFKGLSLTDQRIMFENLFSWDDENGDIPNRKDFKKWVLAFFGSPVHINNYISDMESDIELSDGDAYFSETDESYRRQIEFLKQFINNNTMKDTIDKFLHLKHITGAQRQNISSNSKVLIRFFERNQSDAFKQLNDLFKEQYDIELIEVFKEIKDDINHIAIKMEELEEEYLNTK